MIIDGRIKTWPTTARVILVIRDKERGIATHTFYVAINEGRNREVRRLWESQETTVSRLKRVRYGDIYLDKKLPRGGWKELDLQEVNYLRELVELKPEKETLLDLDPSNTSRKRERSRSQKIRRVAL